MSYHIEAVVVSHNSSPYMELMLRSLFARHRPDLDLVVTIYDNASGEDMAGVRAYSDARGVPLLPSGFTARGLHNSHGEILRRFVLSHPDCTHELFLDADAVFVEDETIPRLRGELDAIEDALGIMPRLSWDGVAEIPEEVRRGNPDLRDARLHPCCARRAHRAVSPRGPGGRALGGALPAGRAGGVPRHVPAHDAGDADARPRPRRLIRHHDPALLLGLIRLGRGRPETIEGTAPRRAPAGAPGARPAGA